MVFDLLTVIGLIIITTYSYRQFRKIKESQKNLASYSIELECRIEELEKFNKEITSEMEIFNARISKIEAVFEELSELEEDGDAEGIKEVEVSDVPEMPKEDLGDSDESDKSNM